MFRRMPAACLVLVSLAAATAHAEETIVFFRHGEKPSGGYGQLTCQGLNRALALPDVLIGRFGTPDYLYAPNPAVKISDPAGRFFYVRPERAADDLPAVAFPDSSLCRRGAPITSGNHLRSPSTRPRRR